MGNKYYFHFIFCNMFFVTAGNEEGVFRIDPETGEVFLNGSVDHERTDKYALLLRATNPSTVSVPYKPGSQCATNCTDPSSVYLFVNIMDYNEKPPEFSHQTYNACKYRELSSNYNGQ